MWALYFHPWNKVYTRVNARKTDTIWHHNSSFGVAIGHSFWKMKTTYLKFLLEMANLEVIRLPFFQIDVKKLINFNLANLSHSAI